MVYGAKKSITAQKARLDGLQPLWFRLKRCLAPPWQKLQLIYVALWPKAFYGVSVCTLGWGHIKGLRTSVMKAMQWNKAGANSGLRLALQDESKVDPGYYQVHHVLTTFRRMASKQPGILDMWTSYMEHYDGKVHQGPFAKLLEVCQQLRWMITPPHLIDRHGTRLQWLSMDDAAFAKILEEAWTWKIWEDISDRKDMQGLYGLDKRVIQAARRKLVPHHRNTIAVLQDGTFVESKCHAKYDFSKQTTCRLCGAEDSLEHRCAECPALHEIYAQHEHVLKDWAEWTPAKKLRLLPSANPHLQHFRRSLAEKPDTIQWNQVRRNTGDLNIFTDGSCLGGDIPEFALGSWAIVDPVSDTWVARGCLGGHRQSGDRAELRATLAAVEYALKCDQDMNLWTDSTYCADGIRRLLNDSNDIPNTSNHDEWMEMQGLLQMMHRKLCIQHVAGHGQRAQMDNDVSDWTARWNDRVDREAALAHRLHGETLNIYNDLWKHHEKEVSDLLNLQNLHIDIAEQFHSAFDMTEDAEEDIGDEPEDMDITIDKWLNCPTWSLRRLLQ